MPDRTSVCVSKSIGRNKITEYDAIWTTEQELFFGGGMILIYLPSVLDEFESSENYQILRES